MTAPVNERGKQTNTWPQAREISRVSWRFSGAVSLRARLSSLVPPVREQLRGEGQSMEHLVLGHAVHIVIVRSLESLWTEVDVASDGSVLTALHLTGTGKRQDRGV